MKLSLLFTALFLGLLVWGCSSSSLSPSDVKSAESYYPLEKGNFIIYDVVETDYTFVDGTKNFLYQLKETVKDTLTLQDGQLAYKLERYTRTDTTQDIWDFDSLWVAYKTASQAIKYESNVPYVKMVFPLKLNTTWNGNQLNNNSPDISESWKVVKYGTPTTINGVGFNRTIDIIHRSDSSCRGKFHKEEIYADGIGLVYRAYINYTYEETDPPCTPPFKIEVGQYYIEKYRRHGKE